MRNKLLENVLNLFFPPVCGFCGELGNSYICSYCNEYLNSIIKCKVDTYDDKYYKKHMWIFEYKDEVREKIIDYKFNDKAYIYRSFSQILLCNKKVRDFINEYDILIPVPIHKKREKNRGYNQSELIAKEICKNIDTIELRTDIIEKILNIKPQSSLTKENRITNVVNAYKIKTLIDLQEKRILLIDDVYTTGSTVNECSKIILETKCSEIGIITISKDI